MVNANAPPPKMTGGGKRKTAEEKDKEQAKKTRRSRALNVREFERMWRELEERFEQRKADVVS